MKKSIVLCLLCILLPALSSCDARSTSGEKAPSDNPSAGVSENASPISLVADGSIYLPQTQEMEIPAQIVGDIGWLEGTAATDEYLYILYRAAQGIDNTLKLYRVAFSDIYEDDVRNGYYPISSVYYAAEEIPLPDMLTVPLEEWLLSNEPATMEYGLRFFTGYGGSLYLLSTTSGTWTEGKSYIRLYRFDQTGRLIQDQIVTDALKDLLNPDLIITADYLNADPCTADAQGNLYISSADTGCLRILDASGNLLHTLNLPGFQIRHLTCDDQGHVYMTIASDEEVQVLKVHADSGSTEQIMSPGKPGKTSLALPAPDGKLYFADQVGLYACDTTENSLSRLLIWANYDIVGNSIIEAHILPDGHIFTLENDYTMSLLTRYDAEDIPTERETVVLGVLYADDYLKNLVADFNNRNCYYKLELVEYGYENGSDRIEAEIATGKGPDLFSMSAVYGERFVKKGYIADLSPYLQDGRGLERADLVESVLRANTLHDVLVCIPDSFQINTLYGKSDVVGEQMGWTLEEYLNCIHNNYGADVIGSFGIPSKEDAKAYMVLTAVYGDLSRFVDMEKGEAHFDSDDFIDLLKTAQEYPVKLLSHTSGILPGMNSGQVLLSNETIICMSDYLDLLYGLEKDVTFIGYPSDDGTPCYGIRNGAAYGIRAGSEHKDGAWAFIEFLLTMQTGKIMMDKASGIINYNFPTRMEALKYQIDLSMVKSYQRDSNYYYLKDSSGNPIEGPVRSHSERTDDGFLITWDVYAATPEDVEKLWELIDNVSYIPTNYDNPILRIITEEIYTCLADNKTAEETAAVIQNRVQLFLDENR